MGKDWKPRRVRSEDDRGGSSAFMLLDEGEKFLGYALFAGDPTKDDPGYYEYMNHWVGGAKGGRSVPCAGEDCPVCEDGERPRDVALTLWLVTKDEKGNDLGDGELRIFRMNSIVIKQLTEMRSEDEPIKGVQFRVTRMDDRGNYMLQPKPKKLSAADVKEHLKSKDAPDFDNMVTSQLRKAMEGLAVARAMDDDDDDDDDNDKKKQSKKSSAKSKKDEKADWPDEASEIAVTVTAINSKKNIITVESDDYEDEAEVWGTSELDLTDLDESDEITLDYETDNDGDKVASAFTAAGEEKKDEAPDVEDIEDETLELVKVSKKNSSVDVEWQDETITLVGDDDTDLDAFSKGDSAVISATYDSEEESWTLTSIEEPEGEGSGDGGELPAKIEDVEFIVTGIDTRESTMEVQLADDDDLAFTLFFLDKGPASEVDFDDYKEGTKIVVSAEKDSVGDMVATLVPTVVEDKKKSSAKSGKKSSKKGGKK